MCDVLDKVKNRGIEKGIVKGESRGEKNGFTGKEAP